MKNVDINIGARTHSRSNNEPDSGDYAVARQQPSWRWWLCGALLTLATIIESMLSPYLRHEWKVSLGHQPASYTELSFNDAIGLPTIAMRGKAIHVSFTVTNESSEPVSYRYLIASGSGVQLKSLGASSNTVAPGASWVVSRLVVPRCSENTCRVQVSLPQQNEKIDFILALKPAVSSRVKSNS